MKELIAKKYIKALTSDADLVTIENMSKVFSTLADAFHDEKFVSIMDNPHIHAKEKLDILLPAVAGASSDKINNLMNLLVENRRINIIPAIAEELKKSIANSTKTYEGVIYSNKAISKDVISKLASGLSKKFDSTVTLTFLKNDFNGIKVEVEALGVEINLSKDRIDSQMIEHIIKAI